MKIFTIILFYVLSLNAFSEENHFEKIMTISSSEKAFTKDLIIFLNELEDRKLISRNIEKTLKELKDVPAFNFLKDELLQSLKIAQGKLLIEQYKASCENLNFSSHSNFIEEYIQQEIRNYCKSYFLKILGRNTKDENFALTHYKTIQEGLAYYLSSNEYNDFISILEKASPEKILHTKLSNDISNLIIDRKIPLDQKIIKNIAISPKLTEFIQEEGFRKDAASIFYREHRSIYRKIKSLISSDDLKAAMEEKNNLINFYTSNKHNLPKEKSLDLISYTSDNFAEVGVYNVADELLDYAIAVSDGETRYELIYKKMWLKILQKDFSGAKNIIAKYEIVKNFSQLPSKLMFWSAYVLKKNGETVLAKSLFEELTKSSPMSFYSIIAIKKLEEMTEKSIAKTFLDKYRAPSSFVRLSADHYSTRFLESIKRISLWAHFKEDQLIEGEIDYLLNMPSAEIFKDEKIAKEYNSRENIEHIIVNIAKTLNNKGSYLNSFKLIYRSLSKDLISFNSKILTLLFPFEYFSKIQKYSKNLNPLLILSLIRQESAFNPEARSIVGARGLMQIMPSTARMLKRRVRTHHLNKPEVNIKLGVKYFKRLLKKYNGNLIYALAAYNAGEGRIKRWKKNIFSSDDPLITVESIPFQETRNYVKLIYRNFFFYKFLSNHEGSTVSLEESFKVSYSPKR